MTDTQHPPILAARGLTYSVNADGAARRVLHGANLELRAGDTACVSGPSGAGKTSLLWVLARMLRAEAGELFLNGRPAADFTPCAWRARVALVMQNPALAEGAILKNLLLPWTLKVRPGAPPDRRSLELEMQSVGLGDVELDRDTADISGGQAARVALVRSLITRPGALLVDEPTAALDDESADLVFARIGQFTQSGGAVVAVLHRRTPQFAHRAFRLDNGRLEEVGP